MNDGRNLTPTCSKTRNAAQGQRRSDRPAPWAHLLEWAPQEPPAGKLGRDLDVNARRHRRECNLVGGLLDGQLERRIPSVVFLVSQGLLPFDLQAVAWCVNRRVDDPTYRDRDAASSWHFNHLRKTRIAACEHARRHCCSPTPPVRIRGLVCGHVLRQPCCCSAAARASAA